MLESESKEAIESLRNIQGEGAEALCRAALEQFGDSIALASSFSLEDVALIHMLASADKKARIFALDTGRLNEETYEVAQQINEKYGIKIDWYFPDKKSVQKLISEKGLYSFRESVDNRKQCCFIRKVEPLGRALQGLSAWMTGQRRSQSITREGLEEVEFDAGNSLIKLNPLASWDSAQVSAYVRENNIPYNKLYDKSYASIGCAPCTRAICVGEDGRAGRWWWENPEHKECGLHYSI